MSQRKLQSDSHSPLKCFCGESANAVKILILILLTLIANLLPMVIRKGLKCQWSFSGLATMARISLVLYYVDFYSTFNNPE